jgi:hypothetical protein
MCGAGAREGGNPWNRGPITAYALFLRNCNAHGRERRNKYYEYETYFSTQFAKIANDKVGIRAADVALGLRRVPAGCHTVVHLERRTENKRPSFNNDVVEWSGPVQM